jgi:hypothetical protein
MEMCAEFNTFHFENAEGYVLVDAANRPQDKLFTPELGMHNTAYDKQCKLGVGQDKLAQPERLPSTPCLTPPPPPHHSNPPFENW